MKIRRNIIKIGILLICLLVNVNLCSADEGKLYYLVNVHEDGSRDDLNIAITSLRQADEILEKGKNIKKKSRSVSKTGTLAIAENVWTGPLVRVANDAYALVDVCGYQYFDSADGIGLDTYTNVNGNASGYYDAAYLGTTTSDGKFKVKLSGKVGYITRKIGNIAESGESNIVPLSQVKSPSYYEVRGSELIRYYSKNILADNSYYAPIALGVTPPGLSNGKYYSFDGNYFYTRIEDAIDDAKGNTIWRAVNKNNPYYNYYQYLSARSRTNITADDMNRYLNYRVPSTTTSKLRNEGQAFITHGNSQTINPAILYAIACNESAYGKSNIALNKNNIFGISVHDTATGNGFTYPTVEDCIKSMSKIVMSLGYCDVTGDARYAGTFAGNKDSGINVKYAADPYWGEKIASHYYSLDKYCGFKDFGKYIIGIKQDASDLNTRKAATTSADPVYKMKNKDRSIKNLAVIIDSQVTGQSVSGNNKWYKIRSETILDGNKNTVNLFDSNIFNNIYYNYNDPYIYAHSAYLTPINIGQKCVHNFENVTLQAATCLVEGKQVEKCKECGFVKSEVTIPKLAHDYKEDIIKEATCGATGLKKLTCTKCNTIIEETIPATGKHKYDQKIVEPTCTEPKKITSKCTVCNHEETKTEGNALGHNFEKWVIEKEATEFDDGIKHSTCSRCSYKATEIILATGKYTQKDGELHLEKMNYNSIKGELEINGFLAIRGVNNQNKKYKIQFVNKQTGEKIVKELVAQTSGYPYEIPDMDGVSIKNSWFKGNINLFDVKEGNYEIYIIATQDKLMTRSILSNYYSKPITKKAEQSNRGYTFITNYYKRTVPVEMTIRNNGLISKLSPPTNDDMYNYSRTVEFKNNKLRIRGCSFNVGGDYSKNKKIERKIILEETKTFKRYEYDIGYIDNGDYQITLNVPDGKDKTRAWFDASIDVSALPKGTYSIYARTMTDGIDDSGLINDVFNPDLSNIKMNLNDKKYSLKINAEEKYSLELIVN